MCKVPDNTVLLQGMSKIGLEEAQEDMQQPSRFELRGLWLFRTQILTA